MAKDTLLDIVQSILSDSDGDEVNDIAATVESQQAASIIKDEFSIIVDEFDLKHYDRFVKLDATDATTPTLMSRPEGFHSISSIKYDKKTTAGGDQKYRDVCFKEPEDFLNLVSQRTLSDSNVEAMTLPESGHVILVRNDEAPTYWTIFEGYDYVVFDSYDSVIESNLQQSKNLARGVQRPTLALTNTSVPNLPQNQMVLLKNRARAMFFDLYKDGVTTEIAKRQRQSEVRAQRKKYITRKLQEKRTGPNHGRK